MHNFSHAIIHFRDLIVGEFKKKFVSISYSNNDR